uniref:Anthocyanidin 3-O-glucosyltransferase 2-like n=1 Tax=Rhizophora mucronata TaxID=61149 RepID=A0A2P2MJC2_RHIMU
MAAPLPVRVLPGSALKEDWFSAFFRNTRLGETKSIMVKTFVELESRAVSSLSHGKYPPVYPVGPVLNLSSKMQRDKVSRGNSKYKDMMGWLDDQPHSSVVSLCFGSMVCFEGIK